MRSKESKVQRLKTHPSQHIPRNLTVGSWKMVHFLFKHGPFSGDKPQLVPSFQIHRLPWFKFQSPMRGVRWALAFEERRGGTTGTVFFRWFYRTTKSGGFDGMKNYIDGMTQIRIMVFTVLFLWWGLFKVIAGSPYSNKQSFSCFVV